MHCVLEMLQGYATQLEMTIVMKCTACIVFSKYFEKTKKSLYFSFYI